MPRGRKAQAEQQQAVAAIAPRLPVPDDLTAEEEAAWKRITGTMPADYFTPEMIPLMKHHVRTAVLADQNAHRLQQHLATAHAAEEVGTAKEERRWYNLVNAHLGLGKSLKSSATSLRLTPQSRHRADKVLDMPPTAAAVWED